MGRAVNGGGIGTWSGRAVAWRRPARWDRDRLEGRGGSDTLDGRAGEDVLLRCDGLILALDGETDAVSCGPGDDAAALDLRDRLPADLLGPVAGAP